MRSVPAYEKEPYRIELPAVVVETGEEKGRPWAVLDDTILYPEGGGQPSDRGSLGSVAVLDVQKVGGAVRHSLAAPVEAGPTVVRLDWARRFDHMQQHTGQHLLTAVAQDRFNWPTTAFHLGETVCDVELGTKALSAAELARLEEAVAAEIRSARPVTARRVAPEELAALGVRTRGLPEGHEGDVRLVEIAGCDLNTCGGTHLASTAEIEALKLLGTEALRGGTRLFFVAGGRLRLRLGAHEERNAALRSALGAPDDGLVEAAAARVEQLRAAEKRSRGLEEELAVALADALVARPGSVTEAHFDGKDLPFVQGLARRLAAAAPGRLFLLTAERDGSATFALSAGAGLAVDPMALGREVATILGGKGGGSGRVFQGKAGSLERRAEAFTRLAATVPSGV